MKFVIHVYLVFRVRIGGALPQLQYMVWTHTLTHTLTKTHIRTLSHTLSLSLT